MKSGTQVALAVGFGYLLGRRRKMRPAMMLAAAAMTGAFGGFGGQLMRRGTKLAGTALASNEVLSKLSPELGEISRTIRGDLLDAAKGAALSAVNSRIDSLSDGLRDRADKLREPAETLREPADKLREPAETLREPADKLREPADKLRRQPADVVHEGAGRAGKATRRLVDEEDEEAGDEEFDDEEQDVTGDEDDEQLIDEPERASARREPRRAQRAVAGEDAGAEEAEEDLGEDVEDEPPVRARSRPARAAGAVTSPVRRVRR